MVNKYKVKYFEVIVREGYVIAESEDDAREEVLNGNIEDAKDIDSIEIQEDIDVELDKENIEG